MAAAERMFLTHGFAKTSVNAIVREAGGSLATLYAEFGTKEGLFESVLSERARRFFPAAQSRPRNRSEAETELRLLATHMLRRMLSEDSLAVYRVCVHEGPNFPSLRKAILDAGMPELLNGIAAHLEDLAQGNSMCIEDSQLAASQFVALVQGQLMFRAACGDLPDAKTRSEHVQQAVRAFLKLYPACDGK